MLNRTPMSKMVTVICSRFTILRAADQFFRAAFRRLAQGDGGSAYVSMTMGRIDLARLGQLQGDAG